jgi:hypothetical protein
MRRATSYSTRKGEVVRLKNSCRAYSSAVKSAHAQYDGHNGETAVICWGKLKNRGSLLSHDASHDTFIREAAEDSLPPFITEK